MQRWVLVRDGLVRGYLLSEGEPDAARKRALAFGTVDGAAQPPLGAPPPEEAGAWVLVPQGAGLVGDDWRLAGGSFLPPAVETGPHVVSGTTFLALFTAAEVGAMWQSGPEFMVAALRIAAQNEVNLDSQDLARLLTLAAGRGALSATRLPEIIAGRAPG